ncbi:glycoside hydrolase family 2 protein [Frigoribacterium sp. ACAM 257]|uniref:glycoside hydrolase family 2 TIM barrel-domain containing protein n=1 Tax=Frigoribacterium sp. ACAM 257 TaxID=2508998 RepID=UPI0011B9F201|nr:glycoside hydrolase family 2 TIM barrel-domain containing protein [Frigoribacterium sp. ACAM 257]TWX34125.1 glycoside hydrolase family 2 protein [Frigoribacterium sp. ACAM 257]
MERTSFNDGWAIRPSTSPFLEILGQAETPKPVTLPHDALLGRPRSAENQPGALTGYYGDGVVEYVKTITVPHQWQNRRVELQFDGVYRGAMVFVNDALVGQRPYGYIPFSVRIDDHLVEGANEIRVECRSHSDARWYTGLGIYRDVWMLLGEQVHIARNGVRTRTLSADSEVAVVAIDTTLESDDRVLRTALVTTEIVDASGQVVAVDTATFAVRPRDTSTLRQRFTIASPQLWSAETPHLHTCRTTVKIGEEVVEVHEERLGIRALEWDARRGLRINGSPVKLRGGCVHHDNGVIGAATIARAEERRVELLKAAGYNAIRSAHNPISEALLDACDRLGLMVMDEFTDGWTSTTAGFGYGHDLADWWRRDLPEMLARDYNHPSVIMYSIGNEVADTGNDWGATLGRDMVDLVKSIDDSRPITNGVNPMMTSLHDLKAEMGREGGVNSLMRDLGDLLGNVVTSDMATDRLEDAMSQLDIAGYNYASARYELDIKRHSQRLLLGTEGTPNKLHEIWPLVEQFPQIIGDFAWTAWEYIGEAGLGADKPASEPFFGNYPWRLSMTGDIGITGQRRTISYWREIVWGLRTTPHLAVHRPEVSRADLQPSLYTWSDSTESWTWPGFENQVMTVEVYSDALEVELLLNGQTVGRAPAGRDNRWMATFEVPYERGELTAVAIRGGARAETDSLRTAQPDSGLSLVTDRDVIRADDTDLAYVDITIADSDNIVHVLRDDVVTVRVEGSGTLQGLGSAAPASEDDYTSATTRLYLGRALAVVRPTGPGQIRVIAESSSGLRAETALRAE